MTALCKQCGRILLVKDKFLSGSLCSTCRKEMRSEKKALKNADFAFLFSRTFTHVYRNHEEGFQLAIATKFDRGRTFAEKTIESVIGNEITPSEISDIIDASFRNNELALDELIIHSFAKMIVMARGGSVETIEQGLLKDKHEEILKGVKAADKELKRGYIPKEASEFLEKSSERRITNLVQRELGAMQNHHNASKQHSRKSSYTIKGAHGEFGYEETNPIPTRGQQGSVDYLSRLQCKCGDGFFFHRLGSGGQCPDGHVVDVYELLCMSGCTRAHLFVDMYHPKPTSLIPDGLTVQKYPIVVGMPYCIQGFPSFLVNQRPEKKTDSEKLDKNEGSEVCHLISPEMKAAMGILDEAEFTFQNHANAFSNVRKSINTTINSQSNELTKLIRNSGKDPRIWVYSVICNISGDYAESGQYHVYRGVLNPMGESFLAIYDLAMDELVKIGEANEEIAKDQKSKLREGIASVG